MFKAKVYFVDGNMEYIIVAGYDVDEVCSLINEEFGSYNEIKHIDFERISDCPKMTIVSVDVYDMLEY